MFGAGLCAGSVLAKYGYQVTVCEAHYHAGECSGMVVGWASGSVDGWMDG